MLKARYIELWDKVFDNTDMDMNQPGGLLYGEFYIHGHLWWSKPLTPLTNLLDVQITKLGGGGGGLSKVWLDGGIILSSLGFM